MALWTIADLHLSLGEDKPMDIFRGWDNHVERLEQNWNALVEPEDTVVIIGDVSWAMQLENLGADFKFIDDLNGRKIIIKGNHDYWWETMKKMNAYVEKNGFSSISFINNNAFLANGISVCGTRGWSYDCPESEEKILNREVGRLKASIEEGIKLGGEPIVFLHYPPVYADYVCDRIMDVLKEYGIKRCYYGHLHGYSIGRAVNGEYDGITFRLVSCDGNGFAPAYVGGLERKDEL